MPRRKKSKTEDTTTVAAEQSAAAVEAPPVSIEQPVAREDRDAKDSSGDRFRSWLIDHAAGYERLTDEKAKLIVLKFAGKPAAEVLEQLKGAGFQYRPEYQGHQKAWTRRNDFEGRESLRDIELSIRGDRGTDPTIPF